jgi:hypothetical protein
MAALTSCLRVVRLYIEHLNRVAIMPKQLTIRSDEAYEIAHRAAKRTGKTVNEVVVEALRERHGAGNNARGEVSAEDAEKTYRVLTEFAREVAKHKPAGAHSDHRDLYDDIGLPR